MINILYATKVNIGGWASFTRHLVRLLGDEARLLKIGNNTEGFLRPWGEELSYQNMRIDDLDELARTEPMIIAAIGKHYVEDCERLLGHGAATIIHDTAESSNRMKLHKPWVIRRALLGQSEGSVFMRHPYVRHQRPQTVPRRSGAVATSRVDFDKNTRMILDANRLGANIKITGFENRLYTKFKICPDYPEWVQSKGDHPRSGVGSYEHCLGANYMVDLTDIKGDGGGTQYTFLEAWDAGAIPVIGKWWLRSKDDMEAGGNCIAVADAQELKRAVKGVMRPETRNCYLDAGEKQLKKHSAKVLVPQIKEWLNAR